MKIIDMDGFLEQVRFNGLLLYSLVLQRTEPIPSPRVMSANPCIERNIVDSSFRWNDNSIVA